MHTGRHTTTSNTLTNIAAQRVLIAEKKNRGIIILRDKLTVELPDNFEQSCSMKMFEVHYYSRRQQSRE